MKCTAIIVAAGKGQRLGSKIPKAFVRLNGIPMVEYSLRAFQDADQVSEMVLVRPPRYSAGLLPLFEKYPKLAAIIPGGRERSDSVRSGLKAVSPDSEMVLIHDAARPLISPRQIAALISGVKRHGAALLAEPVTDTLKAVERDLVVRTVDRRNLWRAQTPQGFKKDLIEKAHRLGLPATDDCQLAEMLKAKILVIPARENNMKVTDKNDMEMAAWLLRKKRG
jgi:2-C-methyl-D-erythritol 4-phosphate cytidylyltransferase